MNHLVIGTKACSDRRGKLSATGFVIFGILSIKTTLVFLFYGSESLRNPRPAFTGASLPFLAGYIHFWRWALFFRRLRYPAMNVVFEIALLECNSLFFAGGGSSLSSPHAINIAKLLNDVNNFALFKLNFLFI